MQLDENTADRLIFLVAAYQFDRLTEHEAMELSHWRSADPVNEVLFVELTDHAKRQEAVNEMAGVDTESVLYKLIKKRRDATRKYRVHRWLPYAAAVVLALALGWLYLDSRQQTLDSRLASADIAPGGNRATLTLADGRTIDLSTEQSGIIVGEGITYLDGTEILDDRQQTTDNRQAAGKESLGSSVSRLLSLTTPKGGQYQVTLPDGSKVWLNSGSTLTYPSRFDGDERIVFLEGEAYFDIKSMPLRSSGDRQGSYAGKEPLRPLRETSRPLRERIPFIVKTSAQTVQVLGTEFNISAYPDEPETKTTLVEGAVQIVNLTAKIVNKLRPGEQSIVRDASTEVHDVDTEQYVSWRDGFFYLEGTIPDILKEISRWYDIEVVYEDRITETVNLAITFPRDRALDDVLHVLQRAVPAMRYRIEQINKGTNKQSESQKPERRLTIFRK